MLLRIEDHDRERCRPEYDAAILEDLAWLGFVPDAGPVRQHESATPYEAALERLRADGLVYACDCARSTFAAWSAKVDRPWHGPGCPGGCRDRGLAEDDKLTLRVALGSGAEDWTDRYLGQKVGEPSAAGDIPIHDRHGNWTYGFTVVVDDLRQSVGLVVRGEDLTDATPAQIRLGRLLGRSEPPAFAHHALIHKPGGAKLSKADGDTGIRSLRAAGLGRPGLDHRRGGRGRGLDPEIRAPRRGAVGTCSRADGRRQLVSYGSVGQSEKEEIVSSGLRR